MRRFWRSTGGQEVVEYALLAAGVVIPLLFAIIFVGQMLWVWHSVAEFTREGARYAATHGGMYLREGTAQQTGVPAIVNSSELKSYLARRTALLDPNLMQVNVAWTAPSTLTPVNMPTYVDVDPTRVPPGQEIVQNNVIVTVTYQWFPEVFGIGPLTLTSTSQMPMAY